jgi:hypothetical protein
LGLTWDEKKIHHICTCGKVFGVDDWRIEDRIGPFSVITRVSMSGFTRYDIENGGSPENKDWYETEITRDTIPTAEDQGFGSRALYRKRYKTQTEAEIGHKHAVEYTKSVEGQKDLLSTPSPRLRDLRNELFPFLRLFHVGTFSLQACRTGRRIQWVISGTCKTCDRLHKAFLLLLSLRHLALWHH